MVGIPHDRGVTVLRAQIVGREAEIEAIEAFLGDRGGLPASLVIEGPAGAGKSTLWQAAVGPGGRGRVPPPGLPTGRRGDPAFARGALGPADAAPRRRHRRAARAAAPSPRDRAAPRRTTAGEAPDQRAIAAGTLSALRALAPEQPVAPRHRRRPVARSPVGRGARVRPPAAARRAGRRGDRMADRGVRDSAFPPTPHRGTLQGPFDRAPVRIEVGPLSLGALNRLLRTRTSLDFNRRTLQRIHETSGGNPFYALELARALERAHGTGTASAARVESSPAAPLPLSADLSELLTDRLTGFDAMTRSALFVAAAASPATVKLVGQAVEQTAYMAHKALEPAVAATIVRIDGDIVEFTHPLFAAAAYDAVTPGDRRKWHARIAEVATDPETSARHLALGRPGPDPEVSALLAEAARHARERGAPGAAAELFAEAIERLAPDPAPRSEAAVERAQLVLEAAPILAATGEPDRARRLLEASIDDLEPGPFRASLVLELAQLVGDLPGGGELEVRLVDQVLEEAKTRHPPDRAGAARPRAGLAERRPAGRRAADRARGPRRGRGVRRRGAHRRGTHPDGRPRGRPRARRRPGRAVQRGARAGRTSTRSTRRTAPRRCSRCA